MSHKPDLNDLGIDWDDWFAILSHVPGGADLPARWDADAAAFRATARAELDLPYGPHARHRMDLFLPDGPPEGLAIFVHGGYWLRFDKSSWSHYAAGALASGFAVAMPSYRLAPEASHAEITADVAAAIATAADRIAGPIHLAGHSAGGHLATRMACDGVLPVALAARLTRVVSISGVHDLRRLRLTAMNDDFKLTAASAIAESPVFQPPLKSPRITAWVGAQERPEFLAQTRQLEEAWTAQGAIIDTVYDQGCHHFDVLDGLLQPYATLCQAWLS